jgi:ribosome production factor 2
LGGNQFAHRFFLRL